MSITIPHYISQSLKGPRDQTNLHVCNLTPTHVESNSARFLFFFREPIPIHTDLQTTLPRRCLCSWSSEMLQFLALLHTAAQISSRPFSMRNAAPGETEIGFGNGGAS